MNVKDLLSLVISPEINSQPDVDGQNSEQDTSKCYSGELVDELDSDEDDQTHEDE